MRVTLSSNVHRLPLSPWGLSQLTSTIQNQIPYATGSLIGFTHQRGLGAVIGCSLQGPHRLQVWSTAGLLDGQKQLRVPRREPAGMCRRPGAVDLELREDGINISTSAIVVMFLHWQISVSWESKLPWGGGNGKVKDMQGKTLAGWEMKTIPAEGKIDERLKGEESGTKGTLLWVWNTGTPHQDESASQLLKE